MSECNQSEKLSDYLDGNLVAAEREELETHLAGVPPCRGVPTCAEELTELRALVGDLRGLVPGPVPDGGWEALESALAQDLDPGRVERRRVPRAWFGMAAGFLVGVLLLAWAVSRQGVQPSSGDPAAPDPVPSRVAAIPTVSARLHDPAIEPQVVRAMRQEKLPEVVFRQDRLVDAGAELRSLDALIEAAEGLAVDPADPKAQEFHDHLRQLQSLREDLLTEMTLQAQADRTANWQ